MAWRAAAIGSRCFSGRPVVATRPSILAFEATSRAVDTFRGSVRLGRRDEGAGAGHTVRPITLHS
jgi:hypothetical protein